MRVLIFSAAFAYAGVSLLSPCLAQQAKTVREAPISAEPAQSAKGDSAGFIPSFSPKFKAGDAIPGFTVSPVTAMPLQCSSTGDALLEMLLPPKFQQLAAYLISDKRAREIPLNAIPGVSNPMPMGSSANRSLLALMLYASGPPSIESGSHHGLKGVFLAEFRADGEFKKVIELKPAEQYIRFALLSSGDLVFVEVNQLNDIPQITLRDSDGALKKTFPFPNDLSVDNPDASQTNELPRPVTERLAASYLAGQAMFTSYGDKVLLWTSGRNAVTEIGDRGWFRSVNLHPPRGYSFDGFVPATDRWIARFKRLDNSSSKPAPDSATRAAQTAPKYLVFEIAPSDGSLERRLNLGDIGSWLACESDGVLTVFKSDEKGHLIPYTADIGR